MAVAALISTTVPGWVHERVPYSSRGAVDLDLRVLRNCREVCKAAAHGEQGSFVVLTCRGLMSDPRHVIKKATSTEEEA